MKEAILKTAEELFFRNGLQKVRMDDIASSLGISKKTLYRHFSSKDELASAVMRMFQEDIFGSLKRMKAEISDPIERFEKLVLYVSRKRSAICNRFLTDIKSDIPDLWDEIEGFRERQILDQMGEILREGIKMGKIRSDIDTEIATRVYLGAIQTTIHPDILAAGRFSIEEAFSHISRIFLEGVTTK